MAKAKNLGVKPTICLQLSGNSISKSNGEWENFHFINLKHGKQGQTWLVEFISFDN